ncbi:hypothetical protein KY347_06285 [Candidatus Woesearchaeota archaeon]|nr:hypothetical protein [Candidatus Woesearchaeota archaeon]
MEKAQKNKIVKICLIAAYVLVLLVALALSTDKISDTGILLIYLSTWILILHIGFGAYYIARYLDQKETIGNYALNLAPLICMAAGVLFFDRMVIWAASFAVLFSFAMIIYKTVGSSTKNKLIKEYTDKKFRNEVVSVPLLTLLAILAYVFEKNTTIIIILQFATLFFQFFFLVWLAGVKKVYSVFRNI